MTTPAARAKCIALLLACLVSSAETKRNCAADRCTGDRHWTYAEDSEINCQTLKLHAAAFAHVTLLKDKKGRTAGDHCCQFCQLSLRRVEPPPSPPRSPPAPPSPTVERNCEVIPCQEGHWVHPTTAFNCTHVLIVLLTQYDGIGLEVR